MQEPEEGVICKGGRMCRMVYKLHASLTSVSCNLHPVAFQMPGASKYLFAMPYGKGAGAKERDCREGARVSPILACFTEGQPSLAALQLPRPADQLSLAWFCPLSRGNSFHAHIDVPVEE